jgi:hypothetical protein
VASHLVPPEPSGDGSADGSSEPACADEGSGSSTDLDSAAEAAVMIEEELTKVELDLEPDVPAEQASARAARLAVDAQIVDLVRCDLAEGDSTTFDRLADVLIEYGSQIIPNWLKSGAIFAKANHLRGRANRTRAARGQTPMPELWRDSADWRPWDDDAINQMGTDILMEGLSRFRREIECGRWDPRKGASLKTYFIGSCLFAFEKVYGTRIRDMKRDHVVDRAGLRQDLEALMQIRAGLIGRDPETHAVKHDEAVRAMRKAKKRDEQLSTALARIAIGDSHAEAAVVAGISPKALEGRLRRFRIEFSRD